MGGGAGIGGGGGGGFSLSSLDAYKKIEDHLMVRTTSEPSSRYSASR